MAVLVLNLVPYEVVFQAEDLASGKPISNTRYVRSVDSGGAYGADIAGSDVATFLQAMLTQWTTGVNPMCDNLSVNYQMIKVGARAIIGHGYPSASIACGATIGATTVTFSTVSPHLINVGDLVLVTGFTSPVDLNQSYQVQAVPDAFTVIVNLTTAGPVVGTGTIQLAAGRHTFRYQDNVEIFDTTIGGVAGDALPLFNDFSIRRINTGVGRNWKSRISVAIVAEDDQSNGTISNTRITALNATGTQMAAGGWATGGAVNMNEYALSKQRAFNDSSPFVQAETWTKPVTAYVVRPNIGSFVKRKPRLTAPITP
jgi:hypothetical protein